MAEWRIEALADHHERGAFSCGKTPLDVFLRTQASQYARKGTGRTYVAVAPDSARVVGYYTVSASSVAFEHVPRAVAKKLPKHPVPTILLGRLAIDTAAQGQGLDTLLLMDATSRALGIAEQSIAVDAHDRRLLLAL